LKQKNGRIKTLKILEIGQGVRPCEVTLYKKVQIFDILKPYSHPLRILRWNFAQRSGPRYGSATPSLTWIGATSRHCGVKKLMPAVCRFAASSR